MAELAGADLAQRHVVDARNVIGSAQAARADGFAQLREGRMMDEVLIDAERHPRGLRLGDQRRAGSGGMRQGLLDQHRLPGGDQRLRDVRVMIRWNQHMRPIEAIRRERLLHGAEDLGNVMLARERVRLVGNGIDHRRQLHAGN